MTITKAHKSNLAKTAIYLLEKVKPEKFNMLYYLDASYGDQFPSNAKAAYKECGTTCCFAGHGAIALPRLTRPKESWIDYVARVYGIEEHSIEWNFLFSVDWDDDIRQAALRALVFLESGVPDVFDAIEDNYLKSLSKQDLLERLRKFVSAIKVNKKQLRSRAK
jgi:hypothetical protein